MSYFLQRKKQVEQQAYLKAFLALAALFVGMGGIILVFLYSNQKEAIALNQTLEQKTVEVLVPRFSIEANTALSREMFSKKSVITEFVNVNNLVFGEELKGSYAKTYIPADQPLYTDYISTLAPIGITGSIPAGYRAVTIAVNSQSSLVGWAGPTSRVDVVWHTDYKGTKYLVPLIQDVEVLAVDGDMSPPKSGKAPSIPKNVTLLVSIEAAADLQFAARDGSLSLNLRGTDIEGPSIEDSISAEELKKKKLGIKSAPKEYVGKIRMGDQIYKVDKEGNLYDEDDHLFIQNRGF